MCCLSVSGGAGNKVQERTGWVAVNRIDQLTGISEHRASVPRRELSFPLRQCWPGEKVRQASFEGVREIGSSSRWHDDVIWDRSCEERRKELWVLVMGVKRRDR